MRHILVVMRKEIIDALRDRRTNFSSLFGALFAPALMIGMIIMLGKALNVDYQETVFRLPVSGAENAPGLVDFLMEHNVELIDAPADAVQQVRDGILDVVLIIPRDYPEKFRAGQPAPLEMIMDTSRQSGIAARSRVMELVNGYSRQIGLLRLYARGVDPNLLNAIAVGVQDVATPQSQALIFLNMLPFFITLTIFTGGMGIIIDATAGERERGSLEPLLINPARRGEVAIGKYLASLPYAIVSLTLVLLFFWLGFRVVPIEDLVGFPMTLSADSLLLIGLLSLPVVLLASGVQMIAASFTRSFKEAQTYLAFIPVIIGLPGVFMAFSPVRARVINMVIPTYGQTVLFNMILRGESLPFGYVLLCTLVTLAFAALFLLISIRLYSGERILFGHGS